MNKKFLQSVATGVLGLTLAVSCSHFAKKDAANCGAKNGCASSKKECKKGDKTEKGECNKCSSKKEAKKEAKKAKAAPEVVLVPATEAKK